MRLGLRSPRRFTPFRRRFLDSKGSAAATNAAAELAAGTGAAPNAAPSVAPNAGNAAGTGAAYNATVSTSSATNANAGSAAGTGTAYNASVSVKPNAGQAAGTGAALPPGGYFSDEFTGSSIDTNRWTVYNRLGDQVNGEVNAVIPANVRVSGGQLLIDSKFEDVVAGDTTTGPPNPRTVNYSSGQVAQASGPFLYGSIRVRAKLPGGTGLWPCIWMLGYLWKPSQPDTANTPDMDGPNGGWWEIDIAEFMFDHRTLVNNALHFITINRGGSGEKSLPFDATTRFMVYRVDWTATSVTWYVDAEDGNGWVQTLQITGTPGTDIPDTPGYLIIHTAVGGSATNTPDSSTFPQTFTVDYAQVLTAADTPATTGVGFGTASDAATKVSPSAGNAAGTGTAYNATVNTSSATNAPAGNASGTGTAYNASVSIKPSAGAATGTGASLAAAPSLQISAGQAAGTGAAGGSSSAVAVAAGSAAGTGTAYNANVSTSSATNANAGLASGTGTAYNASVSVKASAGVAAGVGAAYSMATADPHPRTVTIRDRGHTVTVRERGGTTTRRE